MAWRAVVDLRGYLAGAARAAIWFALPSAIALTALAVYDVVSGGSAAFAWAAILLGSFLMSLPVTGALRNLAAFLRARSGGAEAPPATVPWPGIGRDLAMAAGKMHREWRHRGEQLDAALAANETILQALPDPLLLMDAERRVTFANSAAEAVLGRDLAGRDLARVLRAPALLGAAEAVVERGTPQDVTIELAGETPRNFVARLQALERSLPDGGAIALLLHDVTEMWRTERLRADFVANASHEIRTPLATLIGAIETMQGPARDDERARERFLGMMQDHAQRIERLVEDLLSLSRIERSEHDAPSTAVELGSVLDHATGTLEWKAQERGIAISRRLPDAPCRVLGDGEELSQVFQNLIDNAIKYGTPKSQVTLSVRPVAAGTRVESWQARMPGFAVTVADNGPGISADHLPRLTERFYRVDRARSRELGGTGLGLAIVKHIVNRHRGALTIESEVGKGSRFTVYLYAAPAGSEEQVK